MPKENILIVDDDEEIANMIEIYLKNEGYNVFKMYNPEKVLEFLNKIDIHLVILDIMMPVMNGYDLCTKIRKSSKIPILILSVKSNDVDKITGLFTGADDYMTKPFNPMELVARVNSQLRRFLYFNENNENKTNNSISIKGLNINLINHKVTLYGNSINLTPKEYDILVLLSSNPGKVFNSEDIFEKVWNQKYYTSNNTVMVHIWNLREKIEYNPKKPEIIITVWGVGYKIEN